MEKDPDFLRATQAHQAFMQMMQQKGQHNPEHMHRMMLEAENLYNEMLNAYPDDKDTIMQLATLFLQTGRNALCVKLLEPLNDGKEIAVLNNIGAAHRNDHRNAEAKEAFEAALRIQRHPDLLANLAALSVNEGCPEEGIKYGRECLAAQPNHPQGDWNLGLLLLENKEYEEGFKRYARGFETGERIIRHYKDKDGKPTKFWKGEDLNGKSIVIHGEQGIGDELLFLQFVPSLIEKYPDMHLVLDVHPRLKPMIERSLNVSDIFPTRKTEPKWNEFLPVDYKDGLGSLPAYFWRDMAKHVPWLKPNPALVDFYRKAIYRVGHKDKPNIGIAWSGGKKKTRTDLRSIPLEQWLPILQFNANFVSLQYTPGAEKDTSALLDKHGIMVHHWPDVVERFEYDHSLALAAACDLVICINTSIVHACGSMGHPCWTLTPHGHAWRYGKKDRRNPFYNSVTQYHQDDGQPWSEVIEIVAQDVKELGL